MILLVTPAFGEHHPINTLDELRWKNRILLIFVHDNADIEHLHEKFQEHADEIDDRNIRFFIIRDSVETDDERTLEKEQEEPNGSSTLCTCINHKATTGSDN